MTKKNKQILITGVSSGIGLSLVKRFLKDGFKVTGTTRNGKLENYNHPDLDVVALNLSDDNSIDTLVQKLSLADRKFDVLINNAGIAPDVFDIIPSREHFDKTISINLTNTIFFTESILKLINEGGKILFISSDMGLARNAGSNGVAYRISKSGINMYTAILGKRLEEQNISVAPVHPGWVRTKLGGEAAPLSSDESAEKILMTFEQISGNGRFYNAANTEVHPI